MPVKNFIEQSMQTRIYEEPFDTTFLKKNRLYKLGKLINWESLEKQINPILVIKNEGRPKHPTRFMTGLLMLQVLENKFDKNTSETLNENIAWQYFCGIRYISHLYSVSEKSIRIFRKNIREEGHNIIMKELLSVALEIGLVKKKSRNYYCRHHCATKKYPISSPSQSFTKVS
jgi:transposase